MNKQLEEIISESNNIVFLGGAGVSTASGIPDFRSADGIYNEKYKFPPEVILSHTFYVQKPDVFFDFYREKMIYTDAKPNAAHKALAKLERKGKIKAVITQNIDGLHFDAGSDNVLELHGSVRRNHCEGCGHFYDLSYIMKTKGVPVCEHCGGRIKPDVVLYEEGLDQQTLNNACWSIKEADTLIIGGTSLSVYPAAGLINYFRGRNLVLINKTETSADSRATLIIREPIDEALA